MKLLVVGGALGGRVIVFSSELCFISRGSQRLFDLCSRNSIII